MIVQFLHNSTGKAYEERFAEELTKWKSIDVVTDAPEMCGWNSNILRVPKKGDTPGLILDRFCIDPRPLNARLKDNNFPVPRIEDNFNKLQGCKFFSKLDLESGFHQIPIRKEDQMKTAFTFKGKQYMFKKAPFGIKTMPAHFQRVIQSLFVDLESVSVYIDDIAIASRTESEHTETLKLVIKRLTSANLKLNMSKCVFGTKSMNLLGFVVSEKGIAVEQEKAKAFDNYKKPETAKDIQRFLEDLLNIFLPWQLH